MTLPDNQPVQPQKETKTCPDCKQSGIKNMGSHKRFCKPQQQDIPETKTIKEDVCPEPIESKKPSIPLIITDILQCKKPDINDSEQLVAWFTDNTQMFFKESEFVGILNAAGECIPTILIVTQTGTILPPFMIPGFMGMFPRTQEWEDTNNHDPDIPDDTEEFPPFPVEEEKTNPASSEYQIIEAPKNTPKQPITQSPSFINKLLNRKPKSSPVNSDTKDILREAINAAKT